MKRVFLWGVLVLAISALHGNVSFAGVNDFTISSFDATMLLSKDTEGRSVLKTTEIITAEFPDFDQNHGLERAIPKTYDNHSTSLKVESVTDQNGIPRTYTTYSDDNGNLVVRMADMDVYVHGQQIYRLVYSQRDVTKSFTNTNADEFYWDINGVDWRVPIAELRTKVEIDAGLVANLNGSSMCYIGQFGSTATCDLAQDKNVFTNTVTSLAPGDNVTVAIGFTPSTFSGYKLSNAEKFIAFWVGTQFFAAILSIAGVGIGIYRYFTLINRTKELGTIVPEYLPPAGTSVTTSSKIASKATGSVMAAQLIDLAVRHYIKIYEVVEAKWYRGAQYEVEIVKATADLLDEEAELLSDMFGYTPKIGEKINLKMLKNNMQYYQRTQDNDKKLNQLIQGSYGLRIGDETVKKHFRKLAFMALIGAILLLSPFALIAAVVLFGMSFANHKLTDKGLALRRYLEGLKMYISVGEEERLKILQSPTGAEKVIQQDGKSLVTLYERVLPYAVLFGQEKEWTKQLGHYYESTGSQPNWYVGNTSFNAAAFSTGMSDLAQSVSYASSSSSSSGGSGGGGSSGGGGGGGGGGGV